MEAVTAIVVALVVFCIFGTILVLCREITCWYLKINERKQLLSDIRDMLRAQCIAQGIQVKELPKETPAVPKK